MTFEEFQATRVERDDIAMQIALCDTSFRPGIDNPNDYADSKPGCTYTFGSRKVLGWIEKESDGRFFVDCDVMNGAIGDLETVERFLYNFLVGACGDEVAA